MEAIHEHVSHMPRFARFLSITDILNQMGEQDEEMNPDRVTVLSLRTLDRPIA